MENLLSQNCNICHLLVLACVGFICITIPFNFDPVAKSFLPLTPVSIAAIVLVGLRQIGMSCDRGPVNVSEECISIAISTGDVVYDLYLSLGGFWDSDAWSIGYSPVRWFTFSLGFLGAVIVTVIEIIAFRHNSGLDPASRKTNNMQMVELCLSLIELVIGMVCLIIDFVDVYNQENGNIKLFGDNSVLWYNLCGACIIFLLLYVFGMLYLFIKESRIK